jgi:hypothetical protein
MPRMHLSLGLIVQPLNIHSAQIQQPCAFYEEANVPETVLISFGSTNRFLLQVPSYRSMSSEDGNCQPQEMPT